jgi:hypothetical protein
LHPTWWQNISLSETLITVQFWFILSYFSLLVMS